MAGHPESLDAGVSSETPVWGDYDRHNLYEALAIWADTFVLVNVFLTLTDL